MLTHSLLILCLWIFFSFCSTFAFACYTHMHDAVFGVVFYAFYTNLLRPLPNHLKGYLLFFVCLVLWAFYGVVFDGICQLWIWWMDGWDREVWILRSLNALWGDYSTLLYSADGVCAEVADRELNWEVWGRGVLMMTMMMLGADEVSLYSSIWGSDGW